MHDPSSHDSEERKARLLTRLAWAPGSAGMLLAFAGLFLLALNRGAPKTTAWGFWGFQSLNAMTMTLMGFLIVRRVPHNIIGWLLMASGILAGLTGLSEEYAWYATLTRPSLYPSGVLVVGLGHWLWLPSYALVAIHLPLLFPDGRYLSPRWRIVGGLGVLWMLLGSAWLIFYPGPLTNMQTIENPFGLDLAIFKTAALSPATYYLPALVPGQILMVLAAASMVLRYRRAGPAVRPQLRWLAYAAVLMPVAGVLGQIDGWLFDVLLYLFVATLPVSIAIAILRYRLFDIDLIINRVLVFTVLTAFIVVLYVVVVGAFGALSQASGNLLLSLLATGLAALLLQPLREWLQGRINRWMYGERDAPAALLARLGEHLEKTGSPEAALKGIVETVAQALKLPYTAIALGEEGEIAAMYGLPQNAIQRFPLIYQGERVGEMQVAERAPGEALTPKDRRLLETIARQAGAAAHAVRLTADLRRARQRLVIAREEERRRIRRDLHDGLGPQLASQTLTLDAVEKLIERDPQTARTLIRNLKSQAQEAISDIRRIIYDLRPSSLDDLGLIGAVQTEIARYTGSGINVQLNTPATLPALPAAVELAVFRIIQEALTNVVRHANASTCRITIQHQPDALCVEIQDDGRGLTAATLAGIGLKSMQARAAELGGQFDIQSYPGRGTRITAKFSLT